MKKILTSLLWAARICLGCAIFALGFDLFLSPNALTPGGISGVSMILHHVLKFGSVGFFTALINLPLFLIGGKRIGAKFFVGSLIGAAALSLFIDLLTVLPVPETEPLLGALYGGILCGCGAGLVFQSHGSTGGSDIVVRLLKQKYRNMPLGQLTIAFDFVVACLTGILFRDVSKTLYSLIAIYTCGQVIDAVIYRFDYSKVALIVSKRHEEVARGIAEKIDRGVTYLYGQGYYSSQDTKVILTAVKKSQLSELTDVVVGIDPEAFIIIQEAHQVLGNRFKNYSKDAL